MKSSARSAMALAGTSLAAYCLPSIASGIPPLRRLVGIRDTLPGQAVALTFDDGPSAHGTWAILNALDPLQAKATFFLVGEQVARAGSLVQEILAAGHGIGVHGHRHTMQMLFTPGQVATDLSRAADAIGNAAGFVPFFYRPPLGVANLSHLAAARGHGWETWLWTADGRDWMGGATPASITKRIVGQTRPGGVLLLHDSDRYGTAGSWRRVVLALPAIVEQVRNRGLNIRPLTV